MRRAARKRTTRPLEQVLKALDGDHTHPFAHELYRRVHTRLPRISVATVYHNLHRLVGRRMAYQDDIALMAHVMRRAGFGAGRDELEARVAKGYEATVEELLHPETQPAVDMYTLLRYQPASLLPGGQPPMGNVNIMYHLVNTKRPLEEKTALFWHHVFATGNSKVDNYDQLLEQIGLFRQQGMGNYRDLLLTIARNPTMIFWLDNNQNHGTAVNENWGRELLELFSMGVGAYPEQDA